jgi:5-methyltetrahydropteroyltriglutamate--homocysteine methyltransferase
MKTAVIGYPRIGVERELKFASEKYFKDELTVKELEKTASDLRKTHWLKQLSEKIDFISSNDFSFYDQMLDTAALLNVIPQRYKELNLSPLDEYFAMARGYQGKKGDVKALAMKKWFNTNYHYMIPEIEDNTQICLNTTKQFDEYLEAKKIGVTTKPVIIGAFTFLKLAHFTGSKSEVQYIEEIVKVYAEILQTFSTLGADWIQFDEPYLVKDLTQKDIALFTTLYTKILAAKASTKVLVQTYFGDIRDCFDEVMALDFDGVGLDFIEGKKTLELIKKWGEKKGVEDTKILFAGVVNGKNIWKNNYKSTIQKISEVKKVFKKVIISTSCSLLHVPYTLKLETKLSGEHKNYLAFADEKLVELNELKVLVDDKEYVKNQLFIQNSALFKSERTGLDQKVLDRVAALTESDYIRLPKFEEREKLHKKEFNFPLLPTTTIGSFPQTQDIRKNRFEFKKGLISKEQYVDFNKSKIAECIKLQENIGLDVLVHGEFERNDMVEYFGESLNGFLFTEKAWVQSYGTRCVKPPIIWGDISRSKPITVEYSTYAQSLTKKPVKGMLTGPITILNWSFPREDISLKDSAVQIALAIRDEVLDLEKNKIQIIQVDEAALKEKLPLRKVDWHTEYLDWAIPAFRLVHSGVKAKTQIHTHMCYSEFGDIVQDIDNMDADVITFEASRSNLTIIDALTACNFKTEVGPGVYDIHSPRIPSEAEIEVALVKMLKKISKDKLWVNPDCGLKTRGEEETIPSLKNLVAAAIKVRREL